jgi:large subunit ribosomal protein L22
MEKELLQAKAKIKNLRGSARKARLVLDLIRGQKVVKAQRILQFSTKRMARHINKLLLSAIANATNINGKINVESLLIESCWANDSTIMKRSMPRANGRATYIKKRSCHINLVISETREGGNLGSKN